MDDPQHPSPGPRNPSFVVHPATTASQHGTNRNSICSPRIGHKPRPTTPCAGPNPTIPIASPAGGSVQLGFNEVALQALGNVCAVRPHGTLQSQRDSHEVRRLIAVANDIQRTRATQSPSPAPS